LNVKIIDVLLPLANVNVTKIILGDQYLEFPDTSPQKEILNSKNQRIKHIGITVFS